MTDQELNKLADMITERLRPLIVPTSTEQDIYWMAQNLPVEELKRRLKAKRGKQ